MPNLGKTAAQQQSYAKESDFNDKIDEAIDDLFKPQRTVEIDPVTSEVKDTIEKISPVPDKYTTTSGNTPKPKNKKVNSDIPDQPKPPDIATAVRPQSYAKENPKPSQLNDLLNELEQSFLTLDWEVTERGVADFRNSLARIKNMINPRHINVLSVISLLDSVGEEMSSTPEKVPPSAAKTLQKGVVLLKNFATNKGADSAAAVINDLQELTTAISHPSINQAPEEEPAFGDDLMRADLPEVRIPLELTNLINLHLTIISQCINRILPLEKLFSQNNLYDKFLNDHRNVRQTLEEEKERLATALNSSYNAPPSGPDSLSLPKGLAAAIKSHITILRECQETILPIEKLAQKKGANKLYKVEKEIRQQLERQITPLIKALTGKYHNTSTSNASYDFTELFKTFKDHIDGLTKCVKQVIPLENLFGKTKGYEKLHAAQKRIRVQLEIQGKQLSAALESATSVPAARGAADIRGEVCPWSKLLIVSWNDQEVALLPDELAFEDVSGRAKKRLRPQQNMTLTIKKLKTWPWSKLGPMFSGELSTLPKSELNNMLLPRLMPLLPVTAKDAAPPKQETLIFLYKNGRGGSAILDSPSHEITVEKEWQWHPLESPDGFMLIGFLVKGEERLPVLSVA